MAMRGLCFTESSSLGMLLRLHGNDYVMLLRSLLALPALSLDIKNHYFYDECWSIHYLCYIKISACTFPSALWVILLLCLAVNSIAPWRCSVPLPLEMLIVSPALTVSHIRIAIGSIHWHSSCICISILTTHGFKMKLIIEKNAS